MTMPSPFESLDDTFNIKAEEVEVVEPVEALPVKRESSKPVTHTDKTEDREKDYQYTRGHLYGVVEDMKEILMNAMEVAQQSDHPRAFEVAFNGAKALADTVEKITDLHKKQKDLTKEDKVDVSQTNVQNNIYMTGSTADLQKLLKDAQENK